MPVADVLAPTIVVAPDSFKGALNAQQVAAAIGSGLLRTLPRATIRACPMADGGEGTLDALLAGGGERRTVTVRDATGAPRSAPLGHFDDAAGSTVPMRSSAVIETAEIASITDPRGMSIPIEERSTLGLGDALRAALDGGATTIFVALGGSSTNDGGAGLLSALGLRILDAAGAPLPPTPAGLARAARVDASALERRLAGIRLVAMADVDNPLTGGTGASAVFGPQKGAAPEQIDTLDAILARFADLVEAEMGRPGRRERDLPGAGAAGGLGFALHLLNAEFRPGAEVVADRIGLDNALADADWLITGEGRSDTQTLHGKAPYVACRRAQRAGVPASLLSGAVDPAALSALNREFHGCFSAAPGPITLSAAIAGSAALLADASAQMALIWAAAAGRQNSGSANRR